MTSMNRRGFLLGTAALLGSTALARAVPAEATLSLTGPSVVPAGDGLTISAWIKSSQVGRFSGLFIDRYGNRFLSEFEITEPNTWQHVSVPAQPNLS